MSEASASAMNVAALIELLNERERAIFKLKGALQRERAAAKEYRSKMGELMNRSHKKYVVVFVCVCVDWVFL